MDNETLQYHLMERLFPSNDIAEFSLSIRYCSFNQYSKEGQEEKENEEDFD